MKRLICVIIELIYFKQFIYINVILLTTSILLFFISKKIVNKNALFFFYAKKKNISNKIHCISHLLLTINPLKVKAYYSTLLNYD